MGDNSLMTASTGPAGRDKEHDGAGLAQPLHEFLDICRSMNVAPLRFLA